MCVCEREGERDRERKSVCACVCVCVCVCAVCVHMAHACISHIFFPKETDTVSLAHPTPILHTNRDCPTNTLTGLSVALTSSGRWLLGLLLLGSLLLLLLLWGLLGRLLLLLLLSILAILSVAGVILRVVCSPSSCVGVLGLLIWGV